MVESWGKANSFSSPEKSDDSSSKFI